MADNYSHATVSPELPAALLSALEVAEGFVQWALDHGAESQATTAALTLIRTAITEANTMGLAAVPSATALLAILQAVLPYAESEAESLYELWKRDGDLQIKDASDRCERAIEQARAVIVQAKPARRAALPETPVAIQLEISEDAFDDHYPLKVNHLNPNASWGLGEGGGCLFETYGEELAFVQQQHPSAVWTFVDGDESDQYLLSGFHVVNRIGYLVSAVPVPEGVSIQVRIPSHSGKSDQSFEIGGAYEPR
jgi:hypothetical protein